MTPHQFVEKWRNAELKERTASQSHFNDLCALLGLKDPISEDPKGEYFTFEKGATKTNRILPKDAAAAKLHARRTLTNLYNERPAWLDHAHRALDAAVADAYGWGDDWRAGVLADDEILARLFRLNQERGGKA